MTHRKIIGITGFLLLAWPACAGVPPYEAIVLYDQGQAWAFGAGDGQQVGATSNIGPGGIALLWSGSPESLVNLHPAGYQWSAALGVSGGWQAGAAGGPDFMHAILWNGSATGFVNLHTPLYDYTAAKATGGNVQAGFGRFEVGADHALLWHGSAESVVVLHPGGVYWNSRAEATDGVQQVGEVSPAGSQNHAALWSGSAASFVDLHPLSAEIFSAAYGVANGQQVGIVDGKAALWHGSASSYVQLGINEFASAAWATNGYQQVGSQNVAQTVKQAATWLGTQGSYHDLHQYLPSNYHGPGLFSEATGIDAYGNIVGYARNLNTGGIRPILWRPVPEPSSMLALGAGIGLLTMRRRRRAGNASRE